MEIKTGISLQTKQQLSQLQVESLNILAMSMTELKDFLQNEEIENPLVEYTSGKEEAAPITYKETERFYNGTDRDERRENELYEIEDSEKSLEDLAAPVGADRGDGTKDRGLLYPVPGTEWISDDSA